MAAQVDVQPGEVGRTVAGGRLHLNPLTDSSNKSLIEIPSINQSRIIASEPSKPVPAPKPRLSPKPFAVERNTTIKPILAPKPQARQRPESTRLPGHKPEPPSNPKPQQPVTGKPRLTTTNPNRPAPTSFKTSNKLNTGQTTKPIVQPFKPAPPFDPEVTSKPANPVPADRQKPAASSYSKSFKKLPAAEWSGSTQKEDTKGQNAQSKGGTSITRAKSMGFLLDVEQEEVKKEKAQPEASVTLRTQPRSSRPRPVSAIFPESPTKSEASVTSPRWAGRRPLSADLTSKFESIGLSLHRKSPKDTQEDISEERTLPQKTETDKNTPESINTAGNPFLNDQSDRKTEEKAAKETDEDKRGVSIKSRISLLLDSSSTPVVTGQGSDSPSPVQPPPETEPTVGVRKLIKQLTEDTTPNQSPVLKPSLRPRPLPLDLTKKFSSERSPALISLNEAADRHEISKDPQRRVEESVVTPSEPKTFLDFKDSQEQLKKASTPPGPETTPTFGPTVKESSPGDAFQTVRASLFENVVERHSVFMMDDNKSESTAKESLSSPSSKRPDVEDEGTLVTATYREPVSPSSPMRVRHAFDTVQAIAESRAVTESVPSAQWEDKAMTLRSKRSDGSRPVAEEKTPAHGQSHLAVTTDPQPRYLRVGALPKWSDSELDQDADMGKVMQKEPQREGGERVAEQDDVVAAPKRLKMLPSEEPAKPRATYFALTGQMQDPFYLGDAGTSIGNIDEYSARSALGGSQGKVLPMERNPSLDEAFRKTAHSQQQVEELMMKSHLSPRDLIELEKQRLRERKEKEEAEKMRLMSEQEILRYAEQEKGRQREMGLRSALGGQMKEEMTDIKNKRLLQKQTERHLSELKEIEREKQRHVEMEEQAHREFARLKELELQREAERQRQKVYEKQKELEEKRRALERQKQMELDRHNLQEMERQKQIELEKQKLQEAEREKLKEQQRQLEKEKQREAERMQERERQRERERQKQREEERQRELDKERRLLELQKEKHKMEEMERIKEQERQQLIEFQKQKQKEKERQQLIEHEKQRLREKREREKAEKMKQMAIEQEMLRMRELDRERERQKELERERQKEIEMEKQRQEQERQRLLELQKEKERQQIIELEKQRLREKREREKAEKLKQMAFEQEMLRIRELDRQREKQKEMEQERQKEIERERQNELEQQKQRERQRQLDIERQEMDKQRLRQREQEKEKKRLEELERIKEMERKELLEFEKEKQAEIQRQQILELEKRRLREKMEKDEAEKMRQIAKQQEAERQRLKEKQRKEEQERLKQESAPLRPKVLDLDSVLKNDPLSRANSQRSDPANRWKEPYKPAILDIDSFTSQSQHSPGKDLFPVSGIQGLDADFGARMQHTPERDVRKVPPQTSGGFSSPVWTTAPQDPWELRPVEMSVDKPLADPRKQANRLSAESILFRQDEQPLIPQKNWPGVSDDPLYSASISGTEARTVYAPGGLSGSTSMEYNWLPRELQPQESRGDIQSKRRSQGSQELNRMRSRSVSRRSAPAGSSVEGNLARVRSRSAHREQDRHSWVPQKQSSEEEGKDSGTPVHDTDSQYGTWETGLRTDDSLTPATPTSDSNLSPSPKKPTPPHTPGDPAASQPEASEPDGRPLSSSTDSQPLAFPDAPTALLDTSALRSRAQLGKKRAPRTRPSRAARLGAAVAEEGPTDDWLYRDSTEAKPERRDDDSDSEEPARGAEASPAVSSQPQRVALFPGMDPSALKAQLKKRGDSDNHADGAASSPSQLSRSPKSPFLPRAARVLPPPGGKENGEEDSPQWLKELKSKKRLSQYENDS